jgi:Holliday junction resolvase
MKESQIERRLVEGVKRLGGMCLKFVSPGTLGVPDRIIITAKGRVIFVELKTETGRPTKIQRYVIGEMQKRGADARVVKGIDEVKELLAEIEGGDEA